MMTAVDPPPLSTTCQPIDRDPGCCTSSVHLLREPTWWYFLVDGGHLSDAESRCLTGTQLAIPTMGWLRAIDPVDP